jgi:hypothetical protein
MVVYGGVNNADVRSDLEETPEVVQDMVLEV